MSFRYVSEMGVVRPANDAACGSLSFVVFVGGPFQPFSAQLFDAAGVSLVSLFLGQAGELLWEHQQDS